VWSEGTVRQYKLESLDTLQHLDLRPPDTVVWEPVVSMQSGYGLTLWCKQALGDEEIQSLGIVEREYCKCRVSMLLPCGLADNARRRVSLSVESDCSEPSDLVELVAGKQR